MPDRSSCETSLPAVAGAALPALAPIPLGTWLAVAEGELQAGRRLQAQSVIEAVYAGLDAAAGIARAGELSFWAAAHAGRQERDGGG